MEPSFFIVSAIANKTASITLSSSVGFWTESVAHPTKQKIAKKHFCWKNYCRIEEAYSEHKDIDVFYEELGDLLDNFSKDRLEGEPYYVVLPEDVEEN